MAKREKHLTRASDEIRHLFYSLETPEDIASILEVEPRQLIYYLYVSPEEKRYRVFNISKKSGGRREISSPVTALKMIQQRLVEVLETVYIPKSCVQGFVTSRSILTNAELHAEKRHVFNIDLKDFFLTINLYPFRPPWQVALAGQADSPNMR